VQRADRDGAEAIPWRQASRASWFINGHTIMHGELGSLGVLIMYALQGNRPEYAREIAERAGIRHRPEELGISWQEIDTALEALPGFVAREGLWYSIANDLVYGEREAAIVREALGF
jgi:glycerol-1-phosphate dehydrogenase [NAD(P)+]